jgi:hypothetical protein
VAELPAHTFVAVEVMVSDGNGLTVMVTVVVLTHPVEFVPVAVYVVVTVGETTTLLPVKVPGFQV